MNPNSEEKVATEYNSKSTMPTKTSDKTSKPSTLKFYDKPRDPALEQMEQTEEKHYRYEG